LPRKGCIEIVRSGIRFAHPTERRYPMNTVARLLQYSSPFSNMCRHAIRRCNIGSYRFRLSAGAVDRPHYAYLVYEASRLAAQFGQPRVSILEFGVAGAQDFSRLSLCIFFNHDDYNKFVSEENQQKAM